MGSDCIVADVRERLLLEAHHESNWFVARSFSWLGICRIWIVV